MWRHRGTVYVSAMSLLAACLAVLGAVGGPSRAAAQEARLPAGFVLTDTPTGQAPYDLTDFAYLPDGSALTTGKSGRLTWVPERGQPRTVATFKVDVRGDLGLVGVGVARDYSKTRHIYLARSLVTKNGRYRQRLSRFTVRGGARPESLGAEKVLLEFPSPDLMHLMTTVLPADDGTLWVSIGDLRGASKVFPGAVDALNLDKAAGKLLHITANAAGVRSNPHFNPKRPRSWRSRTYARGFRSPFRFSLHPTTGMPIVGDVGWRTWEEVDLVRPGGNYAWPCWEGRARTPGYTDLARCAKVRNTPPLWRYHHGTGPLRGNAVTGGIVYTGNSYPARYRDAYFFGDYTAGKIWTLKISPQGKLARAPKAPFASDVGGPVKFGAAANGDIVFADIVSGVLRRLSYSPGNSAPVAKVSTRTNPATRTVTFDASGSVDYDGEVLTYAWDFGDGTTGTGRKVKHKYAANIRTARARLTVTDPLGARGTASVKVAPSNHSPRLRLTTPGKKKFPVGRRVRLTAVANDAEDGRLSVRWSSAIVHCSEATTCHVHPGPGGRGRTWQRPFTSHPDARMLITATVRDSAGVRVSKSYTARPRLRRLRLTSNRPAALEIRAGSVTRSARVTQGARVEVAAAKVATDRVARFVRWSDGKRKRVRTVRIGPRDLTLRARYLTPIGRRYARSRALRATLGRPKGAEAVSGSVRFRRYQRGRLYWSRATGVHEVHGRVLRKYLAVGGHRGLGAPTTDVEEIGRRRRSQFQRGVIVWWPKSGKVVVRRR